VCIGAEGRGWGKVGHLYYSLPLKFLRDFVQGDEIEFGTVNQFLLVIEAFVGLATYSQLPSQGVSL
jgi:hypothetical protein